MKTIKPTYYPVRPRMLLLTAAVCASTLLNACGGGGGSSGSAGNPGTTTAAGTVVTGPITGFGSVIVNGVRFDDSAASVSVDDDGGSTGDLRLGMIVEIEGAKDGAAATGKASAIATASEVRGPVSAIDKTSRQLTVLGLTISVSTTTVFEGITGLDDGAFKAGDLVEVYGIRDAQGGLKATRIEKKSASAEVRSVGAVKNLNATAKTFTLHGMTIKYDQLALDRQPAALSNDMLVRVKGTRIDATTISATRIKDASRKSSAKEGKSIELEGVVGAMVSTGSFEVEGLKIDASKAKFEGIVANGVRIEVEGRMVNGVLVATKVEVKDENQEGQNEMHGQIGNIDVAGKTFVVRNVTVRWDSTTEFNGLPSAASLANGLKIEVKGKTAGNTVVATRIKLED
jgi:hypothetical protein